MCVCVCVCVWGGASIPNIFYPFDVIFFDVVFFTAAPESELDVTAWAFYATIPYYVDFTRRAAFLSGAISVACFLSLYRPVFFACAVTPHLFLTPLAFP